SNAADSVVMYAHWRKLQDPELLSQIEDYNRVDCISTLKLRDWLVKLRPTHLSWFAGNAPDVEEAERTVDRQAAEQRMAATIAELMKCSDAEHSFREFVVQLLEFHKREAKPEWWFQFTRADMSIEELIEDNECSGGLQ